MTSRCLVLALFGLACSGSDEAVSAPSPPPQAPPEAPPEPPLAGFAYLPGAAGDASGARFSRFDAGETVYVGVDDANLRAEDDTVVARLRLGSAVTVLAAASEPVDAIGRRNIWYRVRTGDGVEGRLFGGLLTPYGGVDGFDFDGEDQRGWAVTFSPDGLPRLRVDTAPGSDDAISMDVVATQRFKGGRLEAAVEQWGDFDTRITVVLCRLDGGESPDCSTAQVDLRGDKLVQTTPPDPWKYRPAAGEATHCGAGSTLRVKWTEPAPLLTLHPPEYMRGANAPVPCLELGGVRDGQTLVSCRVAQPDKMGPPTDEVERFLRKGDRWTFLPCASSTSRSELIDLLVEQRITVDIDSSVTAIARLGAPETLPVKTGRLSLAWRGRHSLDKAVLLFEDEEVGKVYGTSDAVVVPQPDSTLLYQWTPTLSWKGPPPSDQEYTSQDLGCAGYAEVLVHVEDGLTAAELETVATLADGSPVGKLKDPAHRLNRAYLQHYQTMSERTGFTPPPLELGLSEAELLASHPWLFVQDPWGRYVRLLRKDFEVPAMCEPILYTYADPPTPLSIAPRAPLRFFTTRPHGPDGWQGIAQPDGSLLIDGQRWPELFWEGRSLWFRAPEEGVVVGVPELETYLRLALAAQGLTPRESAGFLNAWLPALTEAAPVRIAFHEAETIDALAPLDVTPSPDVFLRVLMDAAPASTPPDWDGRPPVFASPPEREGLVVVEWGGLLRE